MATKKKNTKTGNKTQTLTNGAISLVVTLSCIIGALAGWLIAYLTIR